MQLTHKIITVTLLGISGIFFLASSFTAHAGSLTYSHAYSDKKAHGEFWDVHHKRYRSTGRRDNRYCDDNRRRQRHSHHGGSFLGGVIVGSLLNDNYSRSHRSHHSDRYYDKRYDRNRNYYSSQPDNPFGSLRWQRSLSGIFRLDSLN